MPFCSQCHGDKKTGKIKTNSQRVFPNEQQRLTHARIQSKFASESDCRK